MSHYRLSLLFFGLLVFFAPGLRADRVFSVTGVVQSPLDAGRITISHQNIPGYMPAMTMGFDVAGAEMMNAAQLKTGNRVTFQLHVGADNALADHFRVLHPGEAPPVSTQHLDPSIPRLNVGDTVPAFTLENEEGQPFTRGTLEGHFTLVTFIFTRCPVPQFCPLMARRFGELQRAILTDPALKSRVRLLSLTLDPQFDRPEVLKRYGEAVGANPQIWRFGTGADVQIEALVQAFSVYRQHDGALLDHTLCTALIDPESRIVAIWRGNDWKIADILAATRNPDEFAGANRAVARRP